MVTGCWAWIFTRRDHWIQEALALRAYFCSLLIYLHRRRYDQGQFRRNSYLASIITILPSKFTYSKLFQPLELVLFFFVVDSGVLYLVKLLALYFSHDKFLLKCLRKNRDSNYKPHEMTLVIETNKHHWFFWLFLCKPTLLTVWWACEILLANVLLLFPVAD